MSTRKNHKKGGESISKKSASVKSIKKSPSKSAKKTNDLNPDKRHYYIVLGLGCTSTKKKDIDSWIKAVQMNVPGDIPIKNIHYVCHKMSSAINAINKVCVGKEIQIPLPLKLNKNTFLAKLLQEMIDLLQDGNEIYAYGISFGGAILNRLAEEMNKVQIESKMMNRLHIATFGSIYISLQENVKKINIMNYIALGDVAIKCNRLVVPSVWNPITPLVKIMNRKFIEVKNDDNIYNFIYLEYYNDPDPLQQTPEKQHFYRKTLSNITWLNLFENNDKEKPIYNNKIKPGLLIGNKQEWNIHNSYLHFIYYLMNRQTNTITNREYDDWNKVGKIIKDTNDIYSDKIFNR